jgi:hypothetical protein
VIFPNRTFAWLTVIRAYVVWLALRVAMLAAGGLGVNLYSSVLAIAVTVALVTLEGRRRNEHLFLANLGVPLPALLILAGLPPTVMELAIGVAALPW